MAIVHGIPDSEMQLIKILPRKIKSMQDLDDEKISITRKINKRSLGMFTGIKRKRLQNKLKRLKTKKINTLRRGAEGEARTVARLRSLGNEYHVICGADIRLSKYVEYDGTKNLRSAQMDVVVVGPTGLFVLEVKNWTDTTSAHKKSFTPYEQSSRAAKVLGYATGEPVAAIVVDVQGNIGKPNRFGATVCGLVTLSQIITGRQRGGKQYGKKEVVGLVKRIKKVSR